MSNFSPEQAERAWEEEHFESEPEDELDEFVLDLPPYMSNLIQCPITEDDLDLIPQPEVQQRSARAKKLCF